MSTYLKKGIRPAVFIIVLLLLLQGLSYFFITRGNGNKNALSVMKQPENSIDYLVIGDSESYSSISPMEIWIKHGFAGYNCVWWGSRRSIHIIFWKRCFRNRIPR